MDPSSDDNQLLVGALISARFDSADVLLRDHRVIDALDGRILDAIPLHYGDKKERERITDLIESLLEQKNR